MREAKTYAERLHRFGMSFSRYPLRIFIGSPDKTSAEESGSLQVYIPPQVEVASSEREDELSFAVCKGLVALQASAVLYNGVPPNQRLPHFAEQLKIGLAQEGIKGFHDLLLAYDRRGLFRDIYHTFEIARRMQCLREDYPVLGQDMQEGFNTFFDPKFFIKYHAVTTVYEEVELALARTYWQQLGVEKKTLEKVIASLPIYGGLEEYRNELQETVFGLSLVKNPLASSYETSLNKSMQWSEYLRQLSKDIGVANTFVVETAEGRLAFLAGQTRGTVAGDAGLTEESHRDFHTIQITRFEERERKLNNLLERVKSLEKRQLPLGLDSEERIQQRLKDVEEQKIKARKNRDKATPYQDLDATYRESQSSGRTVFSVSHAQLFSDAPVHQIAQMTLPEGMGEEQQEGKVLYFPEYREGRMLPKAVRVRVYDLAEGQPSTEMQLARRRTIQREMSELERTVAEYNRKIHSDVNYIYDDLPEMCKKRDHAEKALEKLRDDLKTSEKIHASVSRQPLMIDPSLASRITRAMEMICPEARTIVRRCFEGEVDDKAYLDYVLDRASGGNPLPTFYYQWLQRQRDVASILLLDASHSANRVVDRQQTLLDILKQSAYYFVVGANSLGDRTAVLAYNGKGPTNSRVFLLKSFDESPKKLRERLELLQGELNNRDGSAIRYATHHLSAESTKTKFLFHIGDMEPSDVPTQHTEGILAYPYRGEQALEDVVRAYNEARTQGIIPVGICLRKKQEEQQQPKKQLQERGLNRALLAKLKKQQGATTVQEKGAGPLLVRAFKNNYEIVEDPIQLPKVLREVYVRVSFL